MSSRGDLLRPPHRSSQGYASSIREQYLALQRCPAARTAAAGRVMNGVGSGRRVPRPGTRAGAASTADRTACRAETGGTAPAPAAIGNRPGLSHQPALEIGAALRRVDRGFARARFATASPTSGRAAASICVESGRPAAADQQIRVLAGGQGRKTQAVARLQQRQRPMSARSAARLPAASPSKHSTGSGASRHNSCRLHFGQAPCRAAPRRWRNRRDATRSRPCSLR